MKIFNGIATAAPEILVPKKGVDLSKWAVIACDQYTSEPEYWQKAEEIVGDAPSTLRMVLPEVYLPRETEEQKDKRLKDIKTSIDSYLESGVLTSLPEGFILIDRKTSLHPSRKGLLIACDLEQYDFTPGNKQKIRATEGTVLDRIPPRVKIRANASIEIPHIMLLIDDPKGTVIEAAFEATKDAEPLYSTDLMQGSGSIVGKFVESGSSVFDGIIKALTDLSDANSDGLLFLVGDGNHSLASAKAHWDNVKKNLSEEQRENHPARYALAEVVNIHDKGLDFEPIHRVVFGVTPDKFLAELKKTCGEENVTVSDSPISGQQSFEVLGLNTINVKNPPHTLAIGTVQITLDRMVKEDPSIEVDYIHGDDSVKTLAGDKNTGILVPGISKDTFFATVSTEGVFPRKTFSMGEAFEKRFYFEAKKIEA